MHRLAAAGAACALAWGTTGPAAAQLTPTPGAGAGTGAMPGQVVGTSYTLGAAGATINKAAPQAGTPIGSPLTRPYDPSKPLDPIKYANLDPNSVVAPISGFPDVPTQQPDLIDRLYAKMRGVLNFFDPTPSPVPPRFTPGIVRRNRERAQQQQWRRD